MKMSKFSTCLCSLLLALVIMLSVFSVPARAAGSAEIKKELEALRAQRSQIQSQMNEIESQKDANWESIEDKVAYKNDIDEQVFLLYSEVENLNEQITVLTGLIAVPRLIVLI